jgi:DNA-binding response OmpR family regulator
MQNKASFCVSGRRMKVAREDEANRVGRCAGPFAEVNRRSARNVVRGRTTNKVGPAAGENAGRLCLTGAGGRGYRMLSARPRAGISRRTSAARWTMRTVLIVEDEPAMLRGLKDNFEAKGYYVLTATDGRQGLETALKDKPDLILLDIMLPEVNGYEVCSHVREQGLEMPIIMLTAKDQESDIVLGLNLGADDYVTKPFSIRELMARAEAFMRRRKDTEPPVYEFGDCRLDVPARRLQRHGREVELTPGEFKMLHLFARKRGCPLTQEEIRTTVWGYSQFITLRDIDKTIASLRRKVEPDPDRPQYIHAIPNIGYKFEPPAPDGNSTDS